MKRASDLGFKVYLYFISTNDPIININRVAQRVSSGGHAVAEDKIIDRYYRSLENLLEAIRYSYRSYIFDNSNDLKLIAEKTPKTISLIEKNIPSWFYKYVVEKL